MSSPAWRAAHREQARAYSRKYRATHPEYYRGYRTAHLKQVRESRHKYYAAHLEHAHEYNRKYRATHPKYQREYYAAHLGQAREYYRSWQAAHPDNTRVQTQLRRARKKTNGPYDRINPLDVWYRDFGYCGICGFFVPFEASHLDHVIPLSKGGTHTWGNVQTSHARCNLKKRDKILVDL